MDTLVWCSGILEDEKSQKHLERKAAQLLEGKLSKKSDYEQEKAIKSFSEGIGYLEKLLQYQRGIHHDQLDFIAISQYPSEYQRKKEEISRILENEINRQYRHFSLFLD